MLKRIQLNFLFQYASLILLILSILLAANASNSKHAVSLERSAEVIVDSKVNYFKTEIVLNDLFRESQIDADKFSVLKTFLDNHNIDLTIFISNTEQSVDNMYKISASLLALGLSPDSFTIQADSQINVASNSALLKLSWSQL